jgi:tetratricopeptide (TPR) repeat protein
MSQTKPPRTAAADIAPAPAGPPILSRGRLIALAVAGLACLASAAVFADWYYGLPEEATANYVGRDSCIQCHQSQHHQFQGSHHDLAMDRATDATVLGDFNDAMLEHHGITSKLFRRDGKFFVNTEGPDGELADFEVKYVFGVDPLQQYMVEFDRPSDMPEHEIARLQVLRISWDTKNKRWFHLDPPDVKEKLQPTDDLHWTGVAQRWNNMCADCHSTNLQKNYDVASGIYHTTFSEIDVSCEACHGPGSLHVQLAKAPSLFWDRTRGYALAQLKSTSNVNEVQSCAPCHSRRRIVHSNFEAGCNYYDYFANELLSNTAYHADGQILDEVYEYGSFIQSKMFHKGVRCSDCHNPHTARLKHQGNQVCTSCHQHPAAKYDTAAHHRHAAGSKGAQCVECHMPQTTYMAVDPRRDHSLRIPRPDLSVQLGTPNACAGCHLRDEQLPGLAVAGSMGSGKGEPPGNDARTGSPPSAADLKAILARDDLKEYSDWLAAARRGDRDVQARLDQLNRWADATLDAWYGEARKRDPHFAAALHAAREMTPDAPRKLQELLADRTQPAIARATAAMELAPYSEPVGDIADALKASLTDRDPQVRAAAVMTLQFAPDDSTMADLVPRLQDDTRLVRTESARVLAQLVGNGLRGDDRARFRAALDDCLAAAEIDNDRAAGHLMRGILLENLDDLDEAERAYETAIQVEPTAAGPRANLAALLDRLNEELHEQIQQASRQGDRESLEERLALLANMQATAGRLREEELGLLERDVRLLPDSAGLLARVGFSRHLAGWGKEAESALRAAALLEPRNPDHAFNLAIYYKDTGRPAPALKLIERCLSLRPGNRRFQQTAEELRASPALQPGPAPRK